ncbi:MAG: GntR family transcriptional regulator [Dysgonamonadaceae bacterium]|jgi:DNA-binding transcriptional regulator YhcF (GntR family)|nr:GntR family transcriptional regulator [Dysgonamonadaceae bacterium]
MDFEFNNKNTKVQQLTDYIQKLISTKELKVGDKLPSINHLSKEFHISRDTVFKAFTDLKARDIIDSVQGKNYYVSTHNKDVLLLLDEYTPFKEMLYNTLRVKLPSFYNIDLWFHQYNEYLFNQIINDSVGRYSKYIVMNYHNEKFSKVLRKIDQKKLLLLDFGNFNKKDYFHVCQDFDTSLYDALETIKPELEKYRKLFFVFNRYHKHPQSSKRYFSRFCIDNNFAFEIIDELTDKTPVIKGGFYLVIKQTDIVKIVKQGRKEGLKIQSDYGLLAYNDNPFYEIIENGISSIGIDWQKMGELVSSFIATDLPVKIFLPTTITKRNSF